MRLGGHRLKVDLKQRYTPVMLSPKLCVMLKILSSVYQSYACGKIFRMP
jgi:hypothetical protein